MKKKIILTAVLFTALSAGLVFAAGEKEEPESFPWKTVKVTGRLSFEDWPHPEITGGGKTWELVVPIRDTRGIEISDGQVITVEGYRMERGPEQGSDYLLVTKAEIDGEVYELESPFRAQMRGGPEGRRPGMDENRPPRRMNTGRD